MSEFSPELIDYLDGKISFEEFEKRREERKAQEKESKKVRMGAVALRECGQLTDLYTGGSAETSCQSKPLQIMN